MANLGNKINQQLKIHHLNAHRKLEMLVSLDGTLSVPVGQFCTICVCQSEFQIKKPNCSVLKLMLFCTTRAGNIWIYCYCCRKIIHVCSNYFSFKHTTWVVPVELPLFRCQVYVCGLSRDAHRSVRSCANTANQFTLDNFSFYLCSK